VVDREILKLFGTTREKIREVLTSTGEQVMLSSSDSKEERELKKEINQTQEQNFKYRQKLENLIRARIVDGITRSLRSYRPYAAVDLAFDSNVLSKISLPLLMYAQGKIDVQKAVRSLESTENGSRYIKGSGDKKTIDLPKFVESECNLVRSLVMRRWAAQRTKYSNLWPYFNYEPRSTGTIGKLRGDIMSQRADIMVDQFGIRHHDEQVYLDGLLYGHSVDFIQCAWQREKQIRLRDMKLGPVKENTETYISKEGLSWINPHPSRAFWDTSHPLTSLNSDSGCEYIGFWDVVRYGSVENNPDYFNRGAIAFGSKFWGAAGIYSTFVDYFNQYNYQIAQPTSTDPDSELSVDIAGLNDRKSLMGVYSQTNTDSSMFVTNYFQKLVPCEWGLGDYPYPIWVRFVVASDSTIIYAEPLTSTPCAVLSINESDSRAVSVSMAMDVLQYQQQMSNLLTSLMKVLQLEAFRAIGINTDALSKDQIEKIDEILKAEDWYSNPVVFKFSLLQKLEQLGVGVGKSAVTDVITVSSASQSQTISSIFDAIFKLVQLADRMVNMSSAEVGQSEPREISATQTNVIAATTQTVYAAVSDSIDSFREAKKRIIYESTVTCAAGEVRCPVKSRYTLKTVRAAGFDVVESEDEDVAGAAKRRTVLGSPKQLVHEYIFSSRDGGERAVNTQAANTLVQLVGYTLSVPEIAKRMGKEKLLMIFNEIFRMSGAGLDLNLEMDEGEDNSFGEDQLAAIQQVVNETIAHIQTLAQQNNKNTQDIATQAGINAQQQEQLDLSVQMAEQIRKLSTQVQEIISRDQANNAITLPEIPYRDAPPSVQAQMEARAGFSPADKSERIAKNGRAASPAGKDS